MYTSDRVDKIMQYEAGDMTEEEMIDFFQELINDGSCWTLQGHYGRTAVELIRMGLCKQPTKAGE